eukprot:774705-Rhodomonas_salina.1
MTLCFCRLECLFQTRLFCHNNAVNSDQRNLACETIMARNVDQAAALVRVTGLHVNWTGGGWSPRLGCRTRKADVSDDRLGVPGTRVCAQRRQRRVCLGVNSSPCLIQATLYH